MSNIIAFIPARGGSKTIPRKNIKFLGNKPLISYSIEIAFRSGLERVIVSTEDEEIAKVGRECGAEVMEMTPEEAKKRGIHQDESSMFSVLSSEILRIEPLPELVLLLPPTAPFRKETHIKSAIDSFTINDYDSLVSVERVPDHYNPAQTIISTPFGNRMADWGLISERITRRQDYPKAYVTSGGIYLFKTSNLDKGSFWGDRVMVMEIESSIDINSPKEWEEAELWLKKLK